MRLDAEMGDLSTYVVSKMAKLEYKQKISDIDLTIEGIQCFSKVATFALPRNTCSINIYVFDSIIGRHDYWTASQSYLPAMCVHKEIDILSMMIQKARCFYTSI